MTFGWSHAYMFNVTMDTGSPFAVVNGTIEMTVSGRGCYGSHFDFIQKVNITAHSNYNKLVDLHCRVDQVDSVQLYFTKTNYLIRPLHFIVGSIQLVPVYIQNPQFQRSETLTSGYVNTEIYHAQKKFFSVKKMNP